VGGGVGQLLGRYATAAAAGQKPKGKRKEKKKKSFNNFQNQILIRIFTHFNFRQSLITLRASKEKYATT
jgi:hypothetical protein